MGFRPGTKITLDNALKMLMVKSANDVAVVIAEGVSGSVEKFSDEMNRTSAKLGMTQSSWVNPNGLPAEGQISSARDLAILARAALHDLPEYGMYWRIPGIKFGKRVMRNYNSLIGRYPGADGMKTGFICASGFNLVATATRNGKQLIAVVLGSPSGPVRGAKTASLLERGFSRGALSWLAPSLGTVGALQPINADPPDLRDAMCGKHRKRPAAEEADDDDEPATAANGANQAESPLGFVLSALPPSNGKPSALLGPPAAYTPVVVHVGPAKASAETQFADAREKLAKTGKLAKNTKGTTPALTAAAPGASSSARDPHTGPVPLPNVQRAAAAKPGTSAAASPSAPGGMVSPSSPPPGTFAPPPNQFTRSARAPSAADNPSWMSFAPSARAEPAPLTAVPGASAAAQFVDVPLPRPRPKLAIAGRPAAKQKKR
jgi:D-alanyl-D-alanine carboxypeptidase